MSSPEHPRTKLSLLPWKLSQAENIFSLMSFRHGQTMREISWFFSAMSPQIVSLPSSRRHQLLGNQCFQWHLPLFLLLLPTSSHVSLHFQALTDCCTGLTCSHSFFIFSSFSVTSNPSRAHAKLWPLSTFGLHHLSLMFSLHSRVLPQRTHPEFCITAESLKSHFQICHSLTAICSVTSPLFLVLLG